MKTKKISKKVIDPIIESINMITRYDIDTVNNGEFIEKTLRPEADGEYIKSEDLKSLLEELDSVKQVFLTLNKKSEMSEKKDKKDKKKKDKKDKRN